MQTLAQVKFNNPLSTVMTTEKFIKQVKVGLFNPFDGFGYYHDGEKETDIPIRFDTSKMSEMKDKYPYVCWYNK